MEKTHHRMARTAKFFSEHRGKQEIVLRVKQGSNPIFGFLIAYHHLHLYLRFLVDLELLDKCMVMESHLYESHVLFSTIGIG